jgi:hypothetical protein
VFLTDRFDFDIISVSVRVNQRLLRMILFSLTIRTSLGKYLRETTCRRRKVRELGYMRQEVLFKYASLEFDSQRSKKSNWTGKVGNVRFPPFDKRPKMDVPPFQHTGEQKPKNPLSLSSAKELKEKKLTGTGK